MRRLLVFFNDTATTEIYTLSLHDALPIFVLGDGRVGQRHDDLLDQTFQLWRVLLLVRPRHRVLVELVELLDRDRKSTRLNSSHANTSYAVFCLKKTKRTDTHSHLPRRAPP